MNNTTRRTFLGGTAALSCLPLIGNAQASLGTVDTVITGGTFYTMDPNYPKAEAIAIRGDRILAVGSADDIANLITADTKVIDARGHTVTPGFIDSHSHPLMANEAISVDVNFRSIPEVLQAIAKKVAQTPAGHWVQAHMYDDTKFVEGRPVNRADLDSVSMDHPIYVGHRGGHTAVVNSKAFEIAGVTLDTPDPEGGAIYRDENGFTGRVAENGRRPFRAAGVWPVADRADNQANVGFSTGRMAASGLTSTTEAAGSAEEWLAYQDSYDAGEMKCRVAFMPIGMGSIYTALKESGMRSGSGNDWIRVGAVKYAADGSASERTMSMSTPYTGRADDYGILTMDQNDIDNAVDDAIANDFRIGIHANGDVAIDMVMNAYERVLNNWLGTNPRLRIEHCSLVNPEILRRIKTSGVIPIPFYTYAYYHGEKWHEYGAEKMNWMFAHKSFLDYGIPVAPGSDFTPGPYEPMMALQSMATRRDSTGTVWGEKQIITVAEAMKICTMNGAYASFEENSKGSLTPGKLADIVLLAEDPTKADLDTIKDIKIVRTIVGGKTMHEA
ncbi:MAG: amidohydrolase [Kordiimonadaceae bacterium]|jgi:predicted amidohydrolase YtcJ|nr:amidohydrolase [Kordiimonadaceae bacterium]MBT6035720.1 amidohydrolase [Kordiimonadaceae bacterium]MBT6330555.1 amidohydrolase [Kordiimonadaceae bacterium]